jgi:hypothetical protein
MVLANQIDVDRIGKGVRKGQADQFTTWMYISCRLLAARGALEYRGMSTLPGQPDYFVYTDPRTHDLYAVQRPSLGVDAERRLLDQMVTLTRGLPN